MNARTIHWLRAGQARLYRRLSEKFLTFSAATVSADEPGLAAALVQGRRLQVGGGDLRIFVRGVPEVAALERACEPGGLCIVEFPNRRGNEAAIFLEAAERQGFDREAVLYFGFFTRLIALPLRLLGVEPNLERPPLAPFNRLFEWLLRLEIPLQPYVQFLTGERIVVILRKPVPTLPAACDLSIVIPAYNEEQRLPKFLGTIHEFFQGKKITLEVLVVDDGSRDRTSAVAAASFPEVRAIPLYRNFGKGGAVREGVRLAGGERILISDADGATPIEELDRLSEWLDRGKDIAIGSRYMDESRVEKKQDALRILISRAGNLAIRLLTNLDYRDTQCGFKLFQRVPAQVLFRNLRNLRFGFDFEILKYARQQQFSVIEVPVRWRDQEGSKITVLDSLNVFWELLRLQFGYFFKFSFVGILNTMIDYIVHNALIFQFGKGDIPRQVLYQACGFVCANVLSYLFNSGFTFRARGAYWKFFLISLVTLIISLFSYWGLNERFNPTNEIWLANVLKLSTVSISFFTNYFGYKFLVYRIR